VIARAAVTGGTIAASFAVAALPLRRAGIVVCQ
jgi:hypothetical protein